jgi:hypothetical protein
MSLEHAPDRQGIDGPAFMNQQATADFLGLSERTLERFRLDGRGPAFLKFGRRVMYAREDVLAWADRHRRTSTADHSVGRHS